jgi:fructoselysine 6-kinase
VQLSPTTTWKSTPPSIIHISAAAPNPEKRSGNGGLRKVRLLAIGDNCVDDYVELGMRYPGGNALNVAVYANRIPGVQAHYIGVIGSDEAGDFLLQQMKKEGLDTSGVIRFPGATSVTTVRITNGERIFAGYAEGVKNANFPIERLQEIDGYDIIHFKVNGFGSELVPTIGRNGGSILSCDFSNRLEGRGTRLMQWLDYCFFSGKHLEERGIAPEEKVIELKRKTSGIVAMTLGENGSLAFDGKKFYRGTSYKVKVVDSLGAGDAYIASFLCARYRGSSIDDSIIAGHQSAAAICKRLGAWGGN